MENYKKAELVADVAAQCGISKAMANKAIDAMVANVEKQVRGGKRVMLKGIGTLKVKALQARTVKSFGKVVELPARKKIALASSTY